MKDFALSELQAVLRIAARGAGVSAALGEELAEAVAYASPAFRHWEELRAMFSEPLEAGFPEGGARCLIDGPVVVDAALATDDAVHLSDIDAPEIFGFYLRRAAHFFECGWDVSSVADGGMKIRRIPQDKPAALPSVGRVFLAPELYQYLGQIAARTHVPATEETRLSGAGAGLNDND